MKGILLATSLMIFSTAVLAEDWDEVIPVNLDVSVFKVSKKQAWTASVKALLLRKWNIMYLGEDMIKMSYNGRVNLAKIDFSKFPKITIVNTPDSDDLSVEYFKSLKRHIYADLVACMP